MVQDFLRDFSTRTGTKIPMYPVPSHSSTLRFSSLFLKEVKNKAKLREI